MPRRDGPYVIFTKRSPSSYEIASLDNPGEPLGVYHTSALAPCNNDKVKPLIPLCKRGRPPKVPQTLGSSSGCRRNQRGRIYTRAFGDGPRNFEPWSSDEDDAELSTSPSFVVRRAGAKIQNGSKELSELTVFNRRKAHLLGQITRIRNSLENVDSPLNQVEKRTKLASLSEVKAKIDKLRTESYRILSDEELMDFETSLDTMEVDADNLEVSLNTLLESSNVDTSELSVKNDFANYNVKLPPINLPEFSGQYIDWLQFKSQFVSLIHDNTCLSDSQKLYYLQSALKGHAKQLQTVNDSYSSLFEALEGRYENKRLIVNSHIAELLNPNKIKFESAFHLRSLIDSIQSHLRALKQLELEPNALCESMLIFVITQRLDDESRKQYEMELHSNDLPKWNNFLDFLIKRSQALENVQRNSSLKNKNEYSPKFRSFVVKSNEKTCPLCPSETHPIFKCKMFHEMSVEERSNKVRSLNLCFNCLGHHLIKNCLKLNRKCRVCNANHNSLLCKTSVPER
ncbi:uncharacterized protein TNCV_2140941 [Trichonephila clavipes]|uniref:Uncharacterized protein n=1 Tax=Trichonephila clavipes TaxID=2585209 RepID=A0A8X6RU79_TRICX|nr:uncharacterized protein TNCV_2140941 [Trichonephila clavipes]